MLDSDYLFVYGTLKSDAINIHAQKFHEQAELVGHARWFGRLYLVTNYPAAIISRDEDECVFGELWKLNNPEQVLLLLDEYEQCVVSSPSPHEYKRSLQAVRTDGEIISAWVYVYQLNIDRLSRIESGIFTNKNQALIR